MQFPSPKPRVLLLFSLLALLAAQRPAPAGVEQTLRASRWQKRVLLLAAPTADHPALQEQQALLAPQRAGLAARDFRVLAVVFSQLSAADQQFLARKLGLLPTRFAAVLLGKDGEVKLRSTRPLAPAALFGTVDRMPMRQQEVRRGGK